MFDTNTEQKIEPPKLIPSLVDGFNAVASHIYIIFFPILLDLLFWFGPLVRVKEILLPVILNAGELSASAYGEDGQAFIQNLNDVWTAFLEQFNLFYGLRTYPIGIPSLLVGKGVTQNPLGSLSIVELQSPDAAFWLIIGLSLAGLILGSLYFALIAGATSEFGKMIKISDIAKETVQSIILAIILILALIILSMPAICLISSLIVFLPSLGSLPFMLFGLILVWIMMPLIFTPHGIFTDRLKATASIVNSIKLVRSLMSAAGLFLIVAILLGYGLDVLWSTPGESSWMLLIGIFGHAFISSGLIAASFTFYSKGMKWMKAIVRGMNAGNHKIIS